MKTHPRIKNFNDLPPIQKWLAANAGKVNLNALFLAGKVKTALDILRLNKPGPLAKAVEKNGWKAMLRPPPGSADAAGKMFYDQASRAIVEIMEAVTRGLKNHDPAELHGLADAIELYGRPADPLLSHFVSLFECKGAERKQVRFPTIQEVSKHVPDDARTIRRRAIEYGVQLTKGKNTEAAHNKRHRVHTALR